MTTRSPDNEMDWITTMQQHCVDDFRYDVLPLITDANQKTNDTAIYHTQLEGH